MFKQLSFEGNFFLFHFFSELEQDVYYWCKKGDLEKVKSMLDPSLINQVKDGESLLHWAADQGHDKIISYLIKQGAEIDIRNDEGQTALFLGNNK